MKKVVSIVAIFIISMLISSSVMAATTYKKSDATMKLVKDEVCDINFGKYGHFNKKKANIDLKNKVIDIDLTVVNDQEKLEKAAGEVVLLIDSSGSMEKNKVVVDGETITRREAILKAADLLVNKLYKSNDKMKIGIAEYAFYNAPVGSTAEEIAKQGTLEDAYINTKLTSNKETVLAGLKNVGKHDFAKRTDIEAGIKVAESMFSKDDTSKKFIVMLTDGIPNVSLGIWNNPEDNSLRYYEREQFDATKKALVDAQKAGYNIISCLIDMYSDSEANLVKLGQAEGETEPGAGSTSKENEILNMTKKDATKYIFGTASNPTAGKLYYIDDRKIMSTVSEDIYNDLVIVNKYALTDIVIKDVIPENVNSNFTYQQLTQPKVGKVTFDKASRTITWTIPVLEPGVTDTFRYRLTLNETIDGSIVGINLPTNQDVEITYKENDVPGEPKHNPKCPVVLLDVPAPKDVPQTGSNTWVIVGSSVIIAMLISVVSFVNMKKNRV